MLRLTSTGISPTITGMIDGANTAFATSVNASVAASFLAYVDGMPDFDATWSGTTLTASTAPTNSIRVEYEAAASAPTPSPGAGRSWVTPRAALQMIGKAKLSQLTNEAGQQEWIGTGDGLNVVFTTPFVFGADLKVYADLAVTFTAQVDPTKGERIVVTLDTAPGTGVRVMASSTDAVNADNLDSAFLRAQGDVRGMIDAALYNVPADDAINVHQDLIGWTSDIAWYYLAKAPRRSRLLEAYPEFEKGYFDTYEGVDSTLKRVAKGTRSLRGVVPYRGVQDPPLPQQVNYSSREKVYRDGRGVF
jgi:Protein of unknown function (DUF1320)